MKKYITVCLLTLFLFLLPVNLSSADKITDFYITISVEAFNAGMGYIVEPIKLSWEEGRSTAYYIDKVLTQNSLEHDGNESIYGFYLTSIRGDSLNKTVSIPNILKTKLTELNTPFDENKRIDKNALSAGDITSTSGWMSTTNNEFADVGMDEEIPCAGDVIRLQFSVSGWGADLGAAADEWTIPYFGTCHKDSLTKTIAEILSTPKKDTLLDCETISYYFTHSLNLIQILDAKQSEINTLQKGLQDAIQRFQNPREEVIAPWHNYRGRDTNMAITDSQTPISEWTAERKWNQFLGKEWANSPSASIIVEDCLITMSGTNMIKLSLLTGEIVQKSTMIKAPSIGSYIPPTYGDGMIFAPLNDGTIQAFDAKTLESLWVYTDPLGGQSQCPITYSDGFLYTGFWNSETDAANFVCLSTAVNESKSAIWSYAHTGGFYWTGSVVIGDTVIVGSDNGAADKQVNETSHIYAFHKYTGGLISDLSVTGDQRSSIAYDEENHSIYFTTKAGYLYSAGVDPVTGKLNGLKGADYGAQSTSTPVVYKGRVYLGLSNKKFIAADAQTLEPIYDLDLNGYPQCSFLLSTAYEKDTGYLYFYSTYNNKPGGITIIRAAVDGVTAFKEELNPLEDFESYCIGSIICGTDGTLYYKNDSGNIFAIANNPAYLKDITISGGNAVMDTFSPAQSNYDITVDAGTTEVTVIPVLADGSTVSINDSLLENTSKAIPLINAAAVIRLVVRYKDVTRTYTFNVKAKGNTVTPPTTVPTAIPGTPPTTPITIKKPSVPKSFKAKVSKKKKRSTSTVTLTWRKVNRVKGYVVSMSAKKKGSYKTIKTTSNIKYRKTKLKKGTYYFKLRSFQLHNKKKVYSSYSQIMKVRIK